MIRGGHQPYAGDLRPPGDALDAMMRGKAPFLQHPTHHRKKRRHGPIVPPAHNVSPLAQAMMSVGRRTLAANNG